MNEAQREKYYNTDLTRYYLLTAQGRCPKCAKRVDQNDRKRSGEPYVVCASCRAKQISRAARQLAADPERSRPCHVPLVYIASRDGETAQIGSAREIGKTMGVSAQWVMFLARTGEASRDGWRVIRRVKEAGDESTDSTDRQGETEEGNRN